MKRILFRVGSALVLLSCVGATRTDRLDVTYANGQNGAPSSSSGIFTGVRRDYVTPPNPHAVVLSDFDRDGILDMAVSGYGDSRSDRIIVYSGRPDGTFSTRQTLMARELSGGIAAGDFDGDGWADLAVLSDYDHMLSIYPGNADATFRAPIETLTLPGTYPQSFVVADLDGDSKLDVVVNYISATLSVLMGNGDGTLVIAEDSLGFEPDPISVLSGDFDGDGYPDLGVLESRANRISVLINQMRQ